METKIRNATGTLMLLTGLPALAQESATSKTSATVSSQPCPKVECVVNTPEGPTLLVAAIIIYSAGVVTGAALAKFLGKGTSGGVGAQR